MGFGRLFGNASLRGLALAAFTLAAAAGAAGCDSGGGKGAKGAASSSASAAASAVPDVQLPGVDTGSLTPRERREWSAQVSELLAPCADAPVSLAACVKEKRACKTCLPAAQLLFTLVQAGRTKKEREDAFHARFDAGKVKQLVLDEAPQLGPSDAVVTVVEWADFDCPFCQMMAPLLEDLVHHFPGQVRLLYRFYPLGGAAHPNGEIAARAAIAAQKQDKFWEMHKILFENREKHEQTDLEGYAAALKLDMEKFKADFVSKDAGARVEREKKMAEELGLDGTPFIFINGRNVNSALLGNPAQDLQDWVKLDIELAGKVPNIAPASSGAPSAAPAASAAPSASATASATAKPPKKQ